MFNIRTEIDLENMKPFGNAEGKNSSVFLADDKQLGNQFIVKKISKQSVFDDYKTDDETNLFKESSILYKVSHPNITEIQYCSFDKDDVYLVMPYYPRGSIQSLLDIRNLTAREIIKYSLDFLSGLMHVHANGLIHFDIKPTNILINNNGKASLTDFGLAKYIDKLTETASPNKLYTDHFPPEIFISNLLTHQADIYQSGVTMYRMANGNHEWALQSHSVTKDKIINGTFPTRKHYLPHIPNKLGKVIDKCLEPNPDKRFNSVLDITNELSNINGNLDWSYQKKNNTEIWELTIDNMKHSINLSFNGNTYDMEAYKTNIENSRKTKITVLNKSNIDLKTSHKMIADYMKK